MYHHPTCNRFLFRAPDESYFCNYTPAAAMAW
jgi:hypothetical protein